MTAEDLLAYAKTLTEPSGPSRVQASWRTFVPAIDLLAQQGWKAIRIKEALAAKAGLDATVANRLYHFICRHLRS